MCDKSLDEIEKEEQKYLDLVHEVASLKWNLSYQEKK